MCARLIDHLAATPALAEVFADASVLQAMLDVEAALARAEAETGVIPAAAADAIARAATADKFDAAAIAVAARESGIATIPLVEALRERVRTIDAGSARFVHVGATSQDIVDSAMVLLLKRARTILAADHKRLDRAMRSLSDRHAHTVMLGRTLLQPAPPITFGLKAAGWVAAAHRGWTRLSTRMDEAAVLQFGGATGTLASLGEQASAVATALSRALDVRNAEAPWHAHRDRPAALVAACGVYTGTLGKIARDVSLLMQDEVGEVAEPGGRSSTMPHKRNPVGCAIALAAATRVPGLVASYLTGMVQEHERSVGGWHAEWTTVAAVIESTGAALAAMAGVMETLTVDADRMRANIERTNGRVFAERVMSLVSAVLGRDAAERFVTDALERSRRTGERFGTVLAHMPEIARALSPDELRHLETPEAYLGLSETFRTQLLSSSRPPSD